jgi:hypothetical protein
MSRHLFRLAFWADAAERAIKTAAQVALVAIGQDAVGADLWGANLGNVAALAVSAALVSLLTSIASARVPGMSPASVVPPGL